MKQEARQQSYGGRHLPFEAKYKHEKEVVCYGLKDTGKNIGDIAFKVAMATCAAVESVDAAAVRIVQIRLPQRWGEKPREIGNPGKSK